MSTPALPRRPPPSFGTATKCRRTARSSRHLARIRRCDGSPSSVNARAKRESDAEEPLLIIDQALDCKFDEPRFALFVRCVVSDWRVITASVLSRRLRRGGREVSLGHRRHECSRAVCRPWALRVTLSNPRLLPKRAAGASVQGCVYTESCRSNVTGGVHHGKEIQGW